MNEQQEQLERHIIAEHAQWDLRKGQTTLTKIVAKWVVSSYCFSGRTQMSADDWQAFSDDLKEMSDLAQAESDRLLP